MTTFVKALIPAFVALLLSSGSEVAPVNKPGSEDVSTMLARSQALQAKREFTEAERIIRQFLTTENILPVHKILALNALGVLMTTMDRCDEAERDFQRALDLAEHNPAVVALALLRIRFNLAAVYIENHHYEKAQALLNKISDADLIQSAERWRFASLRGAVAIRMADYELGKQIFEAHLKSLDPSKPSPELATTLNNLGMIGLFQKDYAVANKYLSQSVAVWRTSSGIRQSNLVRTLANLAVAQQQVGNKDDARASVTESLTIARTQLGETDPVTANIYEISAGVLKKVGSKREAKELKRMAQRIRQQQPSASAGGAVIDITELSALP